MSFEVYTETLSTINRKKLLKLDSKTSIIFQKKFKVMLYMYKKLRGGVYIESETNEYAIYTNTYTYI